MRRGDRDLCHDEVLDDPPAQHDGQDSGVIHAPDEAECNDWVEENRQTRDEKHAGNAIRVLSPQGGSLNYGGIMHARTEADAITGRRKTNKDETRSMLATPFAYY